SPFYPIPKNSLISPTLLVVTSLQTALLPILLLPMETLEARVCRLPLTRYKINEDEFEHMHGLGITRRSSGNWSSALHMVPK
ncbi:hypothetical protein ACTXT7_014208, partial [Hymenolepis weldensis]